MLEPHIKQKMYISYSKILILVLFLQNVCYAQKKAFALGASCGVKKSYSYFFINGSRKVYVDNVVAANVDLSIKINSKNAIYFRLDFGPNSIGYIENQKEFIFRQQTNMFLLGMRHNLLEYGKFSLRTSFLMSLFRPSNSFKNNDAHIYFNNSDIRLQSLGYPVVVGIAPDIDLCYTHKRITTGIGYSCHFVPTRRYYLYMSVTTKYQNTPPTTEFHESFSQYRFQMISIKCSYTFIILKKKDKN